jgi:thymidine phosphorylase
MQDSSFSTAEFIRKKRDGGVWADTEIQAFIHGVTQGTVSDAQIAAYAMAAYFQDVNMAERIALTQAMRDSGTVLDWRSIPLRGPRLDKHSTGGVGDLVSLVLGPLWAACGAVVPMIAGRGLAHTGGTVDKLESIPGYRTDVSVERFQQVAAEVGVAIVGQTPQLAPADGRIYAVRDVTATVEQVGLITASILSKKLAAGLEFLVMDVKVGNGAFMRTAAEAEALGDSLRRVGAGAGLPTEVVVTDMSSPLARSAGNALEVEEAVAFLCGEVRSPRLREVVWTLGEVGLVQAGCAADRAEAAALLDAAWRSGRAAEHWGRMVRGLGGTWDGLQGGMRPGPAAPVCLEVLPPEEARAGGLKVVAIDTRRVGNAVVALGGGRTRPGETIDASVGLTGLAALGEPAEGPMSCIHAADEGSARNAEAMLLEAYRWG